MERQSLSLQLPIFGLSCTPWALTAVLSIRLIIYIDDMFDMVKSETLLRDHIVGILYLLENLGLS